MPRPKAQISDSDSNFAVNLRRAREARGWTLAQLSRACREHGVALHDSGIWKSERSGRTVSIGEALAICAAFDVPLEDMTQAPADFDVQLVARPIASEPVDDQLQSAVTSVESGGGEYLTMNEVADLLRAPISTVRYWRHIGDGPRSFKVGRRVLYARADVEAFVEAQRGQ